LFRNAEHRAGEESLSVASTESAPRVVLADLAATTVEDALTEMSERLAEAGAIKDPAALAARLREREQLGCTGLGGGLAIPHCKWKGIDDVLLAIGRSRRGIAFGSPDGVPVTLIFLLLSPVDAPGLHLQALARISRRLKTPGLAQSLQQAQTAEELTDIWKEAAHLTPLEAHA
jgi:mannitol/fructose-specific phosphotransferase system IIA component (Ntr-type)